MAAITTYVIYLIDHIIDTDTLVMHYYAAWELIVLIFKS